MTDTYHNAYGLSAQTLRYPSLTSYTPGEMGRRSKQSTHDAMYAPKQITKPSIVRLVERNPENEQK